MKNSVSADTGFWVALLNKDDVFHTEAAAYLASCRQTLVTTWPVITEVCYMLLTRRGIQAVRQFLDMGAQGYFTVFALETEQLQAAATLMEKYADLPMDLADASMVLLAEALGHGRILSTDQRDFDCYRWKNRQPFENLLLTND